MESPPPRNYFGGLLPSVLQNGGENRNISNMIMSDSFIHV